MKRVAILGTGLIGASLGLAIRRAQPEWIRVGYDEPRALRLALERGAVQEAAPSAQKAVQEADLVVLAAPVGAIEELLRRIGPHLEDGALVTDTGSVKSSVLASARRWLPPRAYFVGGHPMAGSERSGPEHAQAELFRGATYALCPLDEPSWQAAGFLVELLQKIGARPLRLEAQEHDRVVAATSHLPQLVATVLMQTIGELGGSDPLYRALAGGGFRDMTRLAGSSFGIWRDILEHNLPEVLAALGAFTRHMERLLSELEFRSWNAVAERFEQARAHREAFRRQTEGS
ncbi:MAG: prephenate dehydrogenase/arogenate dehydrogenase family protein [Bacteroidetes bacterium]|nr:prephenate dehydrogenase/arogenate dehydrogenase family protein [Bacteroidota bacterium]MCX7906345.1 prephenate dehydrogenase/arogenate dehydrogenase family protein [Bacteroidota bacterium]MDW8137421.1 prephenate dehydrogenase/arogenate dehydrogenase family protein [Bacteroidota bacterium]